MKFSLWFVLLVMSAGAVIYSAPCDLFFASLFYDNEFYLKDNIFIEVIDVGIEYFIALLFLIVCGICGARKLQIPFFRHPVFGFIDTKKMLFLGSSFFGWCVALPYSFKMFFHRARPYQTDLFWGECEFSNAFEKSVSCPVGDSFISGHTSFALWLFALALIMPERIRKSAVVASLFVVFAVGTSRMLGGYHFFTDVYFAVLLVGSGIFITWKKYFAQNEVLNQSIYREERDVCHQI